MKVNPVEPTIRIGKDLPKNESPRKTQKNYEPPKKSFADYLDEQLNSEEDEMEIDNVTKIEPMEIKKENLKRAVKRFYMNDDLTASYPGIESSIIQSAKGFFSYCFDDKDGYCREFETLGECRRAAREYSRQNPDMEIHIYGISSMCFSSGKEI